MKSGEIKARVEKSIQMTYDLRRAQTAWHFWTDCSSQPPGNVRHTGITDSHISSKIMKNLYKKKEAVSCLSQKGIMEIPHLFTSIKSRTGNTSLTRNPYSPCLRLKCTDTGRDGGQAVMICNIIFIPRTLHFFPLSGIAPILLPWMPLKLSGAGKVGLALKKFLKFKMTASQRSFSFDGHESAQIGNTKSFTNTWNDTVKRCDM